jgi:hypothetical protein
VLAFSSFAAGSLVKWLYGKTVARHPRAVLPAQDLAPEPAPDPGVRG